MDLVQEQERLVSAIQSIARTAAKNEDVTRLALAVQAMSPATDTLATLKEIFLA